MGVTYITREAVQAVTTAADTFFANSTIDRLIESKSRLIENQFNRHFYPFTQTRYYDWPAQFGGTSIRLYLNADLLSLTSLTAGGVAMTSYFLEPYNYATDGGDQQSYSRIEVNLSSSQAFSVGSTPQRAIAATGDWGYSNLTTPAGEVAFNFTSSDVSFDVTDSSVVGVGDMLIIGSERLIVTNKTLSDTLADMVADLTSSNGAVSVTVDDASLVFAGEVITIDSERMYVESISDNVLTVKRAYQGSVLAAHTHDKDIYAPRTVTVTRGAYGSTAAAHVNGDNIDKNQPPQLIADLCMAEVLATLMQEQSAYARTIGAGEYTKLVTGRPLTDLRAEAAVYERSRGPYSV